jgi:hypothetical protein
MCALAYPTIYNISSITLLHFLSVFFKIIPFVSKQRGKRELLSRLPVAYPGCYIGLSKVDGLLTRLFLYLLSQTIEED